MAGGKKGWEGGYPESQCEAGAVWPPGGHHSYHWGLVLATGGIFRVINVFK